MTPALKALAIDVAPPIVIRALLSAAGRRNSWSGNYPNWASAVAASSGYNAEAIFENVRAAAAAVRDGQAVWERDSTCFYHEAYNWELMACLMTTAARSGGALHVLDFGGALGSTYMQHRKILAGLQDCSWNVVEQAHIVRCGRAEFSTNILGFQESIDECFSSQPVNVVLFSSVLQYLENPYELLQEIINRCPAAIIIDRTPLAQKGERITIQHVPKRIYAATYPCRFLDRLRVAAMLTQSRALVPWFESRVDPRGFWGTMSLITTNKHK